MCTKEDMTELQRACHLLKKGWELQKHSVRIFHSASPAKPLAPNQP
jgi:hypothetical protein